MSSKGIEARGIVYAAGSHPILHGVSARFEPGRLHLIIGPNGAGKSTFVKVLSRLLRPREGQVLYNGEDVVHQSEQALAERRAVLSQAIEIAFPLWVHEVVMMGRYPHFSGLVGTLVLAVIAEVMDFTLSASYARKYGGSRRAGWGAIVGGFVGAFAGIPIPIVGSVIGAFLGAFVGAFVFEWSRGTNTTGSARVAWGAFIGRVVAAAMKVGIGLGMAVWILVASLG